MKKISILLPCYNEEGNINIMLDKLSLIMGQYSEKYDYEIIYRDNNSTDGTIAELKKRAKKDNRIKVIVNAKNYGISVYKNSFVGRISGDIVISLASDLQDPPELITEFIKWYEKGYEVVLGQKIASEEGNFKYFLRQLFYRIIDKFSDIPQYRNISGIVLLSRRVYNLAQQTDVFFRYFISDLGCDVKFIQYKQRKRNSGKSSYTLWRSLSFSIDSLIATSYKPLRLATIFGTISSALSFVVGIFYLIYKLIHWNSFSAGMAPVLIGMFFLGSIQLFFIGLLGEYIVSISKKIKKHEPPIVKELINFPEEFKENDPYYIKSPETEVDSQ